MTSDTRLAPPPPGQTPEPRALELRITLADIKPPIWRLVRVPDELTLDQLHRIIQLLFGWLDYHLYAFEAGERRFEKPDEEAEGEDSTEVRLRDLMLNKGARFTYTYDFGDDWLHQIVVKDVYTSTRPDDENALPLLLGGKRAGPHEDSGGPFGYQQMVEALRDPKHSEHRKSRRWVGPDYDPERFDVWMARNNLMLAAAWGGI